MSVEDVNKNLSSLKESALERLEPGYCSHRDTCGRGSSGLQLGVCKLSYDGVGVPKGRSTQELAWSTLAPTFLERNNRFPSIEQFEIQEQLMELNSFSLLRTF